MKRCVLLVGLTLLGIASSPAAAASRLHGGMTSQDRAMVVDVAADGRSVSRGTTTLALTCSDGSSEISGERFPRLVVRRGRFAGNYQDVAGTHADGSPTSWSGSVSGSVSRRGRRVTGAWRVSLSIQRPSGTVTCTTGRVSFRVSARPTGKRGLGGWYGAFTSQGHPVAAELTADGRRVKRIATHLDFECPAGTLQSTDSWEGVRVSASRRFSASVTDAVEEYADGSTFRATGAIAGSIDRRGRSLRGTWRLQTTDDANGTCESGTVRFAGRR